MTIALTIINIIVLLVIVISVMKMIIIINAFEELLARFVEINSSYYKSQQHQLAKLNDLNSDQKKLASTINILKRITNKLNNTGR